MRELRNAIEQAVLLASGNTIDAGQFPFCESLMSPDGMEAAATGPLAGATLGDIERDLLQQALARTGWNVTRAAQLLGVTRDTLRYRIEKHGLKPF